MDGRNGQGRCKCKMNQDQFCIHKNSNRKTGVSKVGVSNLVVIKRRKSIEYSNQN